MPSSTEGGRTQAEQGRLLAAKLRKLGIDPERIDANDKAMIVRDQLTPDMYADLLRRREEEARRSASQSSGGPDANLMEAILSGAKHVISLLFPHAADAVPGIPYLPAGVLTPASALSRREPAGSSLSVPAGQIGLVFESDRVIAALPSGRHDLGVVQGRYVRRARIDAPMAFWVPVQEAERAIVVHLRLTDPAALLGVADIWGDLEQSLRRAIDQRLPRGVVELNAEDLQPLGGTQVLAWKVEDSLPRTLSLAMASGGDSRLGPTEQSDRTAAGAAQGELGAARVFDPEPEIAALRDRFGPGLVHTLESGSEFAVRIQMPRRALTVTLVARPPHYVPEATLDGAGTRRVEVAAPDVQDWAEFVSSLVRAGQ